MTATIETRAAIDPGLASPSTRTGGAPSGRRWIAFSAVLTAMIMNLLDSTILNVAAPSIQRDLGASASAVEWFAAAYTLAIAVGLLTGGRLGDLFGRRTMLLTGLVVQGLFAALITPQCFGLIRDLFPGEQMAKAFAALGPVIGLSTVAGPVVAGGLINADLLGSGWRAVFFINVPLGVFALVVGARMLPKSRGRSDVRLDVVGTVLMAAVSFLLVFPWSTGARSTGRCGSSACSPPPFRYSACSCGSSAADCATGAHRSLS